MSEEVEKYNPYRDSLGRFASGGAGGAGAGGGGKLKPAQEKQMNDLSVKLFNHSQSKPLSVRTGKNTPEAAAWRAAGQKIVSQAQAILGGSTQQALNELNRRMGM